MLYRWLLFAAVTIALHSIFGKEHFHAVTVSLIVGVTAEFIACHFIDTRGSDDR
jgi:hypothetical protein